MKFLVSMKAPDALDDAIDDAVGPDAAEEIKTKVRALCSRWFQYGEYLQVEIDTSAETCTVVRAKR